MQGTALRGIGDAGQPSWLFQPHRVVGQVVVPMKGTRRQRLDLREDPRQADHAKREGARPDIEIKASTSQPVRARGCPAPRSSREFIYFVPLHYCASLLYIIPKPTGRPAMRHGLSQLRIGIAVSSRNEREEIRGNGFSVTWIMAFFHSGELLWLAYRSYQTVHQVNASKPF